MNLPTKTEAIKANKHVKDVIRSEIPTQKRVHYSVDPIRSRPGGSTVSL